MLPSEFREKSINFKFQACRKTDDTNLEAPTFKEFSLCIKANVDTDWCARIFPLKDACKTFSIFIEYNNNEDREPTLSSWNKLCSN